MIGAVVSHKVFGKGTVVEQSESYICVSFGGSVKKFVFPDSFGNYLTTEDDELAAEIAEQKRLNDKKRSAPAVAAVFEKKPAEIGGTPKKREKKPIRRSNIAFKCNYCDGGRSASCVGFKGVCSNAMINYNVTVARHVWCASDSPCRQYFDGILSREELTGQFPCYESAMLLDWRACAGVVQNGENKGTPMKLMKVQKNSLAVLTTRLPDEAEDRRFIFAVFLVDESYEGDGKEEGYVTNNSKWRIELTPSEARQLLFWNYYANKNAPDRVVFGSGLHRYLDDMQSAQILRDIAGIKTAPEEKKLAEDLFLHFCRVTGLSADLVIPPAGALRL